MGLVVFFLESRDKVCVQFSMFSISFCQHIFSWTRLSRYLICKKIGRNRYAFLSYRKSNRLCGISKILWDAYKNITANSSWNCFHGSVKQRAINKNKLDNEIARNEKSNRERDGETKHLMGAKVWDRIKEQLNAYRLAANKRRRLTFCLLKKKSC